MASYIRERSFASIVGQTFRIYIKHFIAIYAIAGIPMLPAVALMALAAANGDNTLSYIGAGLLYLVGSLSLGAVTLAVSDICVGNRPRIMRSWQVIGRQFWVYLGIYAIYTVVFFGGLIALVIPGLVAGTLLTFSPCVCVIERKGVRESLRRSIALGKGHYWRNWAITYLMLLFGALLPAAIDVPILIFFLRSGIDSTHFIFHFTANALSTVTMPLTLITIVLLYYDMRVRKENLDGPALVQELLT
jgi:hypothetical protein